MPRKKKPLVQDAPDIIVGATKSQPQNDLDKPRYITRSVKCPFCDAESNQRLRYSFNKNLPNLIICPDCSYSFLAVQHAELKLDTIEVQAQLEDLERRFTGRAEGP